MLYPAPWASTIFEAACAAETNCGGVTFGRRAIERVGRRRDADQDQHDEAHALLAVVGAVEERDQRAGQDQQPADPERWRLVGGRGGVKLRHADDGLHRQQQQRREGKAEQRREQERLADLGDLIPIHAGRAVLAADDRVGDADADDRPDQGVRARSGNAHPPGAQVPDDRGNEQREHHGVARGGADLKYELNGQQRDDAEGHCAGRSQHAEEIPASRPHDRDLRRQGVGVDDGGDGVRGVVEAVDEFEAERDQQRDAEQNERQNCRRSAAGLRNVGSDRIGHVEQAERQDREDARAQTEGPSAYRDAASTGASACGPSRASNAADMRSPWAFERLSIATAYDRNVNAVPLRELHRRSEGRHKDGVNRQNYADRKKSARPLPNCVVR